MYRKLLDVLADPITGSPLTLAEDSGEDWIEEGELVSPEGSRFRISRGVPRFTQEGYGASFGLQWNRFAQVQLDSANGTSYSRARFDAEVGWKDEDLTGSWVVDAGCGTGRFAEIAASYGAEVIALDLSSSVEAARSNLRHVPNAHVVQADLTKLPVQRGKVDFLYSIGVIQHTPDPLSSARSLVQFLKPGARFAFTIYARRPWTRLYSKYLLRPVTRRLPPEQLLKAIESVMPVAFPVTSKVYPIPVLGKMVQFCLPIANYPHLSKMTKDDQYKQAVLDTFDMLAPRYDRPVTAAEIRSALGDLVTSLDFVSSVPVVVRGVRASVVADDRGLGAPVHR